MKADRCPPASSIAPLGRAVELRRFERHSLATKGSMRFGGRGFKVDIENLSEQGCRFWLPRKGGLPAGTTILLYIENLGPFPAIIRWSRDGYVGAEFEHPVYAPVLGHIRDHLDRTE